MIDLGHKDNWWVVVLDYNNNFLSVIYVVFMLCYEYIVVIYDAVCVGDMLNILCGNVWRRISNIPENMANIMSAGCGSA